MRWRRDLGHLERPRPAFDAHLWLVLWLEGRHWWRKGKASAACLESSAVSPVAAAHLETEEKPFVGSVLFETKLPTFTSPAHLSFFWGSLKEVVCPGTVPASSPPTAVGCPSPWLETLIWACCVQLSPQFGFLEKHKQTGDKCVSHSLISFQKELKKQLLHCFNFTA